MLKPFGDDIWIAEGPEVEGGLGFHYPTRMAVIRLDSGELFIWSPTEISHALRAKLDSIGKVAHLVAPNSLHHTFIAEWKAAYPEARILAAPGLRRKRGELDIAAELGDAPCPRWAGQIEQVAVIGNRITTEIVFFHVKSRTVIFTDLLQQFPPGWFSGWRSIVARLDLMVSPNPSVPRKFRVAFSDRKAARGRIKQILSWPIEKVLMAHGTPVTSGGHASVAQAFRWLSV